MSAIVYSSNYNIGFYGLERLHPFDSRKYGRAWKKIRRHFKRRFTKLWIKPSCKASLDELRLAHSKTYFDKLRDPKYLAAALEVSPLKYLPACVIHLHILNPMKWATQGTILAAETSLQKGFSVNLGGGYHHAKPHHGEGFSIFSDITIAIRSLRDNGLLKEDDRVVYVDTDAHQGNGVCHHFLGDSRVFIFDIFNEDIYPSHDNVARERIDCSVPVSIGCDDRQYLRLLRDRLPPFLDSVSNSNVGLAIYNAGTDVFTGDPLGMMEISASAILERDRFVVDSLRRRNIPTAMVLSGGYTKKSYELVADSVVDLVESAG